MGESAADIVVFLLVVAARLLLPLAIFRYPLPAIIACLVLDAVDQTIFQVFTTLNLDGYQPYDKALDVFYLSIAYIATLRNWTSLFAFQASRFLFYYRLVGVLAFNITEIRWLLFMFPNTFEYFFIFYELVRTRWNPVRLSRKAWIIAVAAIWIVIKLPQEWWIHIAKLDMTDFIKMHIFGAELIDSWGQAFAMRPWVFAVAAAVVGLIVLLLWWLIAKKLPAADWKWRFRADPLPPESTDLKERLAVKAIGRVFNRRLLEKVVLVAFLSVIFAQTLPGIQSTNLQLAVGVGILVVINAFVSHWLAARDKGWASAGREFLAMTVINMGVVLLLGSVLGWAGGSLNWGNTIFFVMMLTLLVTLYDRYRYVFGLRFPFEGVAKGESVHGA
jgi:hypothetical protein